MTNNRLCFIPNILLALLPLTALAETSPHTASLRNNPKTLAYLTHDNVVGKLLEISKRFDEKTAFNCTGTAQIKLRAVPVVIIDPIEFPTASQHPEKGIWQYRYAFTRCGVTSTFNALAIARKSEEPKYITLLPGNTIASPVLQNDSIPAVAQKVILETRAQQKKECDDFAIMNTTVVSVPPLTREGNIGSPWEEKWDTRYCGREVPVPICFAPNAKGTAFMTSKCEDVPRVR